MANSQRKRQAAGVPSGNLNVWEVLRQSIAPVLQERPEDSVTTEEFAEKFGYSSSHAARILRELTTAGKLRKIEFLTINRKRSACYVKA